MQYLSAFNSCRQITRRSKDVGHDAGCFRNAMVG
jgi:hypothetical protein